MNSSLLKPAYKEQKEPKDTGVYTVRGKSATSYEYNFALALEKFKLEYLFQVSYWGGRTMRGGMVLDFLVFTDPLRTPVWINGDYWHSGEQKQLDFLQMALLDAFSQGTLAPGMMFWGKDVATEEDAVATVRKNFGV